MATRVLAGRRRVRSESSEPAHLPEHRVAFALRGLPLVEPAFATVIEAPGVKAWGVLHRIPEDDLARIDATESGAYRRIEREVITLRGERVRAHLYEVPVPDVERPPSRRYLALLLEGAREHGLPPEHIAWLAAHPGRYVPLLSEATSALFWLLARGAD